MDQDQDVNGSSSLEMKRENRSRSRSPVEQKERGSRDGSRGGRGRYDNRSSRGQNNHRVYVANIPYESKWTEVKDLFRKEVGEVNYVELFQDESGKFRGCGVVEMKDNASVQKAIDTLHKYEYRGRTLVVKEDFEVERDKHGRPITRTSRERGMSMNNNFGGGIVGSGSSSQYNTYGLSPQFLESLGIQGPLTCKVFVANLDYKVDSKKLEEVFKLSGKVVNIDLKTDEEGNSKGHGTVTFDHPVEAVQAISMFNGQKLFARTMSVRMDKFKSDESDGLPAKLPTGLQSVGKGLGAGGQPLNLNKSFNVANLGATSAAVSGGSSAIGMGGASSGGLGAMAGGATNLGMGMGAGNMGNMGNMMANNMNAMASVSGMGLNTAMGSNMGMNAAMGTGFTGNMGAAAGLGIGATGANMGLATNTNMMAAMGGGATGMGAGTALGLGAGIPNTGGSFGDMNRLSFNQSTQSSDTVMVENLPASYTWQALRDRFRDVGDVRFAEMKGRGSGLIRFKAERVAQRAVDLMNGIRIDGRPIQVRLY
ncbi:heterogeneous nuclear ribonucleoprotein rumpelstiltskin [Tachypleus tridentatus]|uniref:heterogeneous nuclear ribonucleoprotein rumpelstiltskin n=1 Tax=Tachypleus tridentatus TaxID=6853 RepID=UPI003FD2203B